MSSDESGSEMRATEAAGPNIEDIIKLFMDDRAQRKKESQKQMETMQHHMEKLMRLVEESHATPTGGPGADTGTTVSRSTPKEVELKLTKLSNSDDIEAYLTTFERMMGVFEVDRAKWAFKLAPQLTGRAQQAYAAMAATDAGDYSKMKEAILQRYDINEETYRQRFRTVSRREEESYRQLAIRADDLLSKWTKECKTVDEIRHLVATEQILESLPGEIRVWVRERKPKTATEAGQLADDYVLARRQGGRLSAAAGRREEPNRGQAGARPKCDSCGRIGHRTRECRSRPVRPSGPREPNKPATGAEKEKPKDITCWKCFQKGHIAINCPGAKVMFCDNEQRRKRRSYPRAVRPGLVDGVAVSDIMLDTGSNRTLIRGDLVPAEKLVKGEIPIRCAHGDIITYPIAEVELEIGGRHYLVEAGVVDGLPVSVLLGWDNPDLEDLLQCKDGPEQEAEDAMAVTTRAQMRKREREAAIQGEKERKSGAEPNPVLEEAPAQEEEAAGIESEMPGAEFADELFSGGRTRDRKTKREKRENNLRFLQEQKEKHPLEMTAGELLKLQQEDKTLEAVRQAANGGVSTAGRGFF